MVVGLGLTQTTYSLSSVSTCSATALPPPLSITGLSPNSAPAGGPAFTLTVNGGGFLDTSSVLWNGSALFTTYVSGSQLTAYVGASQIASQGSASVSVQNPNVVPSNTATFTISAPTSPTPTITSGGIVPVGSTVNTIQPGEWVSIYGANLATTTAMWNGNFPTSLSGTSVTINGKAAYLSFVSSGQINLQAPSDTAIGTVLVMVTTGSGSTSSTVKLAQVAPSFLLLDTKHVAGLILRSGSGAYSGGAYDIIGPTGTSLGYSTVAARAGDTIEIFGTGFGPTNPTVPAGETFSGSAPITIPMTLLINGKNVTPTFAGLSGAGLCQLNFTIPSGLGTGDVSLVANVGGVQTPSGVVISLQ